MLKHTIGGCSLHDVHANKAYYPSHLEMVNELLMSSQHCWWVGKRQLLCIS